MILLTLDIIHEDNSELQHWIKLVSIIEAVFEPIEKTFDVY